MMSELSGNFVREDLKTYFEVERIIEGDYRYTMLAENKSDVLVDFSMMELVTGARIRYEICGEKTLDIVFRALTIGRKELVSILKGLVLAFDEMSELLLPFDDIVLSPEYVFVKLGDCKPRFLYLPGYGKDINRQMESFFEYLLNRVDYEDGRTVNLLYDCYTLTMKEEMGVDAIRKRLEKETDDEETECTPDETDLISDDDHGEAAEETTFGMWLSGLFGRKKKKKETEVKKAEEETHEDEEETVLLSSYHPVGMPLLISSKTGEVIRIDKDPYSIGSMKGHTDLTISDNTVSRLHAEIARIGGDLTLSDLNSKNGTRVNGRELVPKVKYVLSEGDVITISGEEYVIHNVSPQSDNTRRDM